MTRGSERWGGAVVASIAVTMLLAGCADVAPYSPMRKDTSMNVEESHQDVLDVFAAVRSVVGEDGWGDDDPAWLICGSDGEDAAQYTYASTRRLPLPGTPDEVAERVVTALAGIGYDGAVVEHDEELTPRRTVISYPQGYLRGTAPDGFAIFFQAFDSYADVSIDGHCVPGKAPKFGEPLNPRPTDLP
ncbi:hypothetical protein EDF52_10471 [Curtobacterium sp. PhB42]|uniref:hypothetical protein n=1 Tax=unclassified Curtobacterium TaxID=257496 RepID=UPI0010456BF2|nr:MULTISPECIES: hypothetical protein [unclassified Curtobacterium]TCU49681.1 hypothetical protein EDF33_101175 [Curtobacterium sp. PhB146]TCU87329.1 hypothetical protein EDF48_101172 [Curtobacterium sp. PhB191]TDW49297.1 hypothetical protein EDF52_10471 [Curtobacterium sp. PhB42]TDW56666.1 hypothetical protein EDF47_103252 [Curtobacterium sp. PhB190]